MDPGNANSLLEPILEAVILAGEVLRRGIVLRDARPRRCPLLHPQGPFQTCLKLWIVVAETQKKVPALWRGRQPRRVGLENQQLLRIFLFICFSQGGETSFSSGFSESLNVPGRASLYI